MENGRRWGEDVSLMPGWEKVGESAFDALTSPLVFIPATSALLLQIGDADGRLSDWASDHTPIAGSNDRAKQLSSDFHSSSSYAFYLSILATPSGNDPTTWVTSKMKGAAVQGGATLLGHTLMNEMKETTGRERPDNSDDLSFPSTMSFGSAVFAGFASKNIHAMNVPSPAKTGMNVVVHTLPYAVAWERVEAKEHYPSDVLAE